MLLYDAIFIMSPVIFVISKLILLLSCATLKLHLVRYSITLVYVCARVCVCLQECAPGYKRTNVSNHEYFGLCTSCECNNHSSTCDPDTGACTACQGHTKGEFCVNSLQFVWLIWCSCCRHYALCLTHLFVLLLLESFSLLCLLHFKANIWYKTFCLHLVIHYLDFRLNIRIFDTPGFVYSL